MGARATRAARKSRAGRVKVVKVLVILEIKEEMIKRESLIHDSIAQDKPEAAFSS